VTASRVLENIRSIANVDAQEWAILDTRHGIGLTPRELEVMRWVERGQTNAEIAAVLSISPGTVRKHIEHVFAKLEVHTRTAAVAQTFPRLVR
jgi:DNA-binding CsgD family transcriptional regulator